MLLNKRISIGFFIGKIKGDIIALSLYGLSIGILDNYSFLKSISIPLGITSVVGTAVALLLAFRTAQSYDRWWEARGIWGSIVNDSRTLIRQVKSFYKSEAYDDTFVFDFGYRQIVWVHVLAQSLRKESFSKEVQDYITRYSITHKNVPNAIISIHADELRKSFLEGNINEFQQIQIDTTLANLCSSMGKCERIKTTVFPRSYSVLIHFLIYFFATILPFGLSDDFLIVEILITISIPVIFIAIEKTSILMQDPFENSPLDIPMTAMCRTIETNIKQMIGDTSIPEVLVEDTYYIM
ncbi:MAG: hypothetical protein C0490_09485 [Marivirga sp.]|nr:hypothetical protein [Marivirga sp.]